MKEDKPYSKEAKNLASPAPHNVASVFVSWQDITYTLSIDEKWDLANSSAEAPDDMRSQASAETLKWVEDYESEQDYAPSDDDKKEKEDEILDEIIEHWSPRTIVLSHIDFKKAVSELNKWSKSGLKRPELLGYTNPPLGTSLIYFINKMGISFTIYEPFIIPYTELYYQEYTMLPEWNLEELDGYDIIEIIYLQLNKIKINLDDWDSLRD